MGRMRGMGVGGGGAGQGKRSGGRFGSSESYILDPLLLPRLEQYAHHNELANVGATVDYLRTNYREYRRKQQGPFRRLVVKAVQILKKRARESRGDSEEDEWEDFSAAIARRDGEDENLQAMEERHLLRAGAFRQSAELEAQSLEDSSENSDGVESEGMSEGSAGSQAEEGGGPQQLAESGSRGNRKIREAAAAVAHRRRGPGSGGKRFGRRRDDKDTSGSEEELAFDGMDEEKPKLNLLNSSLRATYSGRPTLVIESCSVAEKKGFPGLSSSLCKLRSVPKISTESGEHVGVVGESSKAHAERSGVAEDENARPAFAPASVVAEAARAALSRKRSRKGPVLDHVEAKDAAKGSASVASTEREVYRRSPPAQASGRLPQGERLNGQVSATPSFSAPEGVGRVQANPKRANDARPGEEPTILERVQSGVGNYEGPEKFAAIGQEREMSRLNSKRRKPNGGRVRATGDGAAATADRDGSSISSAPQNVSFKNLGGIEDTLDVIREIIEYPLAHPELYDHLGVQPPRGILLHGPPGCGKTMLANAIAVETRVPFLKISAPEVVSGMSGESEAKVRALFAEAVRVAPCIVFIDEIDAITPKRETAQREMERRIVAQLLTCMDDLNQPLGGQGGSSVTSPKQRFRHVVVIGATNRPDALDPALRRAGRFDREIALGIPDEKARARILSVLSQNLRLDGSFDFNQIAKRTPGFVGADLAALTTEAAAVAVKRIFLSRHPRLISSGRDDSTKTIPCGSQHVPAAVGSLFDGSKRHEGANGHSEELSTLGILKGTGSPESASVCREAGRDEGIEENWRRPWTCDEMESLSINMRDFEDAVVKVQPSAKREGFATIPDVTWDDVGSLGTVREELEFAISRPIKHPEEYQAMGLEMATGVLLYGPPGCGKTLVAKAIANDAGANFISVKGPELLNKYVGESERAVRQLFTRARASSPCVLFFDEMDAMAPKRGNDGNAAAERVVNQLLTELDGLESRKSTFIIAATNRPDMIDPALMRPGRLDKLLYVPLPDPQGRGSILRTLVRNVPLTGDVDVTSIGESARCDGFSGADLAALIREACVASLRERIMKLSNSETGRSTEAERIGAAAVSSRHFHIALSRVFPSVSTKDRLRYDMLGERVRYARGSIKSSQQEADFAGAPVAAF